MFEHCQHTQTFDQLWNIPYVYMYSVFLTKYGMGFIASCLLLNLRLSCVPFTYICKYTFTVYYGNLCKFTNYCTISFSIIIIILGYHQFQACPTHAQTPHLCNMHCMYVCVCVCVCVHCLHYHLPPLVLKAGAPQWFCLMHKDIGVPERAMGGSPKL